MNSLKLVILLPFFSLMFGCGTPNIDPRTGLFEGEHLIIEFSEEMKTWKGYSIEQQNNLFMEFEKPGSGSNDILRTAVFRDMDKREAIAFLSEVTAEPEREGCDQFFNSNLEYPLDTPYQVRYWETLCIKNDGKQVKELHLGILGEDALYLIQKRWREKVSQEEVNLWKGRLGKIYVCDTRTDIAPCPITEGF